MNLVLEAERSSGQPVLSATHFFSEFLSNYLKENAKTADIGHLKATAAERSYQFVVEGAPFKIKSDEDVLIKRICTQSTEMLCYLSAVHLDSLIFDQRSYDVDRVFPHLINKYSKDLLQARDTENAFNALEALALRPDASLRLRSFVMYLVGRISDPSFKTRCVALLQSIKRQSELSVDPKREELIFDRSVNISLIYLGESASDYIKSLLDSDSRDEVNRGFHLAYYGDIDYFSNTDMVSHDDFHSVFPRTMASLRGNLVGPNAKPDLDNLSVYTLYSLAFSRLDAPSELTRKFLGDLVEFAENDLLKRSGLFPEVLRFVESCMTFFKSSLIPHMQGFSDVSKLKRTPRAGWNNHGTDRSVENAETVFSHIGSVVYLAVAYLPETEVVLAKAQEQRLDKEYKEYSKEHIVRMLAIHDIGEFGTGDIPSFLKSDSDRAAEVNYVRRVALLSRIRNGDALSSFSKQVRKDHQEFNNARSINARIARDFDKLECLCQLLAYKEEGEVNTIPDFVDFAKSLVDGVSTEIGKEIMKLFSPEGST